MNIASSVKNSYEMLNLSSFPRKRESSYLIYWAPAFAEATAIGDGIATLHSISALKQHAQNVASDVRTSAKGRGGGVY
jgi:hypothetical protein